MLKDIVRFEWRYHTRQLSFIAAALLFFAFGFALTARAFGPSNVNVDSPYSVTQSVALLSLFSLFVLAVFCANAVVRDREHRFEEIVFSTPVETLPFLLGRFTGSFLAAFTAFSACVLGMYAARFAPWLDADRLGSASPLPHLWALLVIALPNLLFGAVVLFALATITRSVLASYAGSVLLWVLYFVGAAMSNSPLMASSTPDAGGGASIAALLDPFGLTAFYEQTRNWTPAVRNTRLLAPSGDFLINRLLWIGASLVILAIVYRTFSFRVSPRAAKREKRKNSYVVPRPSSPFLSALLIELRAFLFSVPFLAIAILWAGLIAFEMLSDITRGEYGSAIHPAAGILFATIRQPLTLVALVLLIYVSAEMVWRERDLRFAGILHATPTRSATFVAAKCAGLAALALALTAIALGIGAALQLAGGWPLEIGALLRFAYVLALPLLLFALLAVALQALSPHKYVGIFIVLLIAILAIAGEAAGLHPLLAIVSTPSLAWSEMNGFGRTAGYHLLMLYSAAVAALLLLFAVARWRGRRERVPRVPAIVAAAIMLAAGGYIAYHARRVDVVQWRADYETRYKRYQSIPQPRIAAVRATLDLGDDEHRVRGEYTLVNDTAAPVGRLLINFRRETAKNELHVPARLLEYDPRFKQYVFALEPPLRPGERITARFDATYARRVLDNDPAFARNGAYVTSARTFPQTGYRGGYEIEDARERRRRGLPPMARRAEGEIPRAEWVRLDLSVSTSGDEIAVAPGTLVRDWRDGARRTFQYRSGVAVPNQFAVSSARYAVAKETRSGVAIEVYYHPAHPFNVERMLRAAADSLAYYTTNFGPYPHRHLRLAEVSVPNFSAFAQPGLIFLGEKRAFLIDSRDPRRLDLVYRRVAHEVAHQWWGYTVVPADIPGATAITESLTKYAELAVLRRARGAEEVRQSLAYELDSYLSGRTSESGAEPPLARAGGQAYLYYRKGALVMNALHDLLGEDALNGALRTFLHEQGGPGKQPTTAHLIRHLHAAAKTPAEHARIEEWMNRVVLYDFTLEQAAVKARPDGRFDVRLRVAARKTRGDDQPLPLRETIDIGLFAGDEMVHSSEHELTGGVQEIALVSAKRPDVAAVDPDLTRIDVTPRDNARRVDP